MKQLLKGNRVFKQEIDEARYLFLPEDRIKKYHYFYKAILIKKGDLLFPNRWINHEDSALITLDFFDSGNYEYMFFPNLIVKDIQNVLEDS
ncbi:hypothetical protein [Peribacillus simplex]|uniref:hypothetical protein n=1 Tax=Peribacillus simplex TaxID=1478 RepID=UPI0024C1C004|nr:hypothetical protein [Peribacillus simplex]WHY58628.1 hypothetical protein QNH43_10385 [Peribacillus simplex]